MSDSSESSDVYALTTIDNPFDPFDEFKEWYAFDVSRGYNSAALLARIAKTNHELSDPDQEQAIQMAIDEIVSENVNGVFMKVKRSNDSSSESSDVQTP